MVDIRALRGGGDAPMVLVGNVAISRICGSIMRRIIAIAIAGALAGVSGGCSSFSTEAFRAAPATVQLELDSVPPGAEAVTSVGPSCKTPCSVAVAAPDAGFS